MCLHEDMFAEEDWNDDPEAKALAAAVCQGPLPTPIISPVETPRAGEKPRRQLLATLRVLSTASQSWRREELCLPEPGNAVAGSTLTGNTVTRNTINRNTVTSNIINGTTVTENTFNWNTVNANNVARNTRNTGTRKRERSQAATATQSLAGVTVVDMGGKSTKRKKVRKQGNGAVNVEPESGDKEERLCPTQRQPPAMRPTIPAGKHRRPEGRGETAELLSRQQWKNHQKNQRRNKNKYRQGVDGQPPACPPTPRQQGAGDDGGAQCRVRAGCRESDKVPECAGSHRPGIRVQQPNPRVNQGERGRVSKRVRVRTGIKQSQGTVQIEPEVTSPPVNPPSFTPPVNPPSLTPSVNPPSLTPPVTPGSDRSSVLRAAMQQRLEGARFRYINQQLYTSNSRQAARLFLQDPEAFHLYHRGYTSQLQRWPHNPLTTIIQYIRNRPASLVVADLGCGDCTLARSVKNKVHSFDLVAVNELVTVCDFAKVPLPDSSVDVAVFCLSLMGTNLLEFLREAWRVLNPGGILKIAEVASRFDDIGTFTSVLGALGFKTLLKDTGNSHFYLFDFKKSGIPRANTDSLSLQLRPCLYKPR